MTLNVNTALYNLSGIDTANVAKVSGEILNGSRNNSQAQVQSIDYSKFNRQTLGVDLYSSRTSAELQKQVSMIQAGLYAKSVNVAKLNASAAANLYAAATVQRNVELTQSTNIFEAKMQEKTIEADNAVKFFNILDSESNSSNGFNPFEAANKKSGKEEGEQ